MGLAPPPSRPPASRRSPTGELGQASLDYVAILGVVVTLAVTAVAATAGASPPELAARLTSTLRHGVCMVSGGVCSLGEARRAGLAPCVIHVRRDAERTGASLAFVRLGRGDSALLERRSDGSASVAFSDANEAGVQAAVGLRLPGAPDAQGRVSAGVAFNTGRAYEFPSWQAAQRFLAAHARRESTAGEALELARGLSPAHARRRMPHPHAVTYETGGWGELDADLGLTGRVLRGGGELEARLGRVLGRRREGRDSTWYVRMESEAGARLGVVAGALGAGGGGETVLALTVRDGRATGAAVTAAAQIDGDLSLYGHSTDLGTLADRLRRAAVAGSGLAGGRGGLALEATTAIDLTGPAERAAIEGVLDVLRRRTPAGALPDRLSALGRRLDATGRLDVAISRTRSAERDSSLDLAAGPGLGVERTTSRQTRELLAAWSAQGGALRRREDCAPVVT